jgi:methionyl-tRNA formyltransferase
MGAGLLVRTIPDYVAGRVEPRAQPSEGVTYAPKIKKSDGQIDWSQTATVISNRVRGFAPWPGAFTHLPDESQGGLVKIWKMQIAELPGRPGEILQADKAGIVVGCGAGALRILMLQREGGRRLSAGEFLAGHALRVGQRLV